MAILYALQTEDVNFYSGMTDYYRWQRTGPITQPLPDLPLDGFTNIALPDMSAEDGVAKVDRDGNLFAALGEGMDISSSGFVSGGIVQLILVGNGASDYSGVFDLSMDGDAFASAAQTATVTDDLALLNAALAGDDMMMGSDLAPTHDLLRGLAGNDILAGIGGNDRLLGGGDADGLFGGTGSDRLWGGSAGDLMLGEAGDDHLYGGAGRDVLAGGQGRNSLTGGAQGDQFVFENGDYGSVIRDFQHGGDQIVISGSGQRFADLRIVNIAGGAVRVSGDGFGFRVLNTDAASLTAADFIFGARADAVLENSFTRLMADWDYAV